MDMGRFLQNIGASGRYNPSKNYGIIVWDENSLIGIIRYLAMPYQ